MPPFTVDDFLATLSFQTILSVTCASVVVGLVLWREATRRNLVYVVTIGTVFLAVFGVGRWLALEPTWEKPLGTTLLWWLFIAVAFGIDALVRRRNGEVPA